MTEKSTSIRVTNEQALQVVLAMVQAGCFELKKVNSQASLAEKEADLRANAAYIREAVGIVLKSNQDLDD